MKYVGKIDDIIFTGKFIIRTTFRPKIGAMVVDKHKKPLGNVHQIIGPVSAPYITVNPAGNLRKSLNMIGTNVYIL